MHKHALTYDELKAAFDEVCDKFHKLRVCYSHFLDEKQAIIEGLEQEIKALKSHASRVSVSVKELESLKNKVERRDLTIAELRKMAKAKSEINSNTGWNRLQMLDDPTHDIDLDDIMRFVDVVERDW